MRIDHTIKCNMREFRNVRLGFQTNFIFPFSDGKKFYTVGDVLEIYESIDDTISMSKDSRILAVITHINKEIPGLEYRYLIASIRLI